MLIALDHDGTYTLDPPFWTAFVDQARKSGHRVVCLTARHTTEAMNMPCEVIYCGRKAKRTHAESLGLNVDVWIDDRPQYVLYDAYVP